MTAGSGGGAFCLADVVPKNAHPNCRWVAVGVY